MTQEIDFNATGSIGGKARPYKNGTEIDKGDLIRTDANRIVRKSAVKLRNGYVYGIADRDSPDSDGDLWANFEATDGFAFTYNNSYAALGEIELVEKVGDHDVENDDWSDLDDL